jgi:signal transduction histidine kinase
MHKLYLQIYVSFVGILVLFGFLAVIVFVALAPTWENVTLFEGIGALIEDILPGPDQQAEDLQAALERYSRHLPADINLRGPDGALIAKVGATLPAPRPGRTQSGWLRSHGGGPFAAFHLPDGRWLVARYVRAQQSHAAFFVGLLAIAIALGAYPLVRRLTRRLERLQTRVDELGAGDLSARVEVEGNDEIASLARSFNRAADQIERLIESQRSLLASASHELRTPLARLSVAAELLAGNERQELRERMEKDIAELDDLVGELLLASRLDSVDRLEIREDIDLLALVAEEAARTRAAVSGEPVMIQGDLRLLRRLIRNLLVNAERYGGGSPIEVSVSPKEPSGAMLRVTDRGPGIHREERERIFEPFYRPAGTGRTGDKGVGVGLGLALVRQIARHHGGDAHCLPREDGGTCFEITLW